MSAWADSSLAECRVSVQYKNFGWKTFKNSVNEQQNVEEKQFDVTLSMYCVAMFSMLTS